jgi:hypothetical protein
MQHSRIRGDSKTFNLDLNLNETPRKEIIKDFLKQAMVPRKKRSGQKVK